MKIKLVCYNILNGLSKDDKPYAFQKSREEAIVKILQKEKPDVLVLCEAWFWPFAKQDKLNNYKKLFGDLYNIYAPAQNSFRWAPIILSKFPISFEDKTAPYKTFMSSVINLGKKKIHLDVCHPSHDSSEKQKTEYLSKLIKNNEKYTIIAGDFNSLSPQDKYDWQILKKGFAKFMKDKAESKIDDLSKYETINLILNKGFLDTYKVKNEKFDYTIPTDLCSKDKSTGIRIDYIFCSKDFKILKSGIIKNKLTEKVSDHYPVYAILEI
jgi:endonuclease/exonuclease/phosphatase family metal-dependent hydrolase